MDVSVIVVNYNTGSILPNCIQSVLSQAGVQLEIIVVDNASEDDSADVLRAYSSTVKVILNTENIGFGRANNLAFQHSCGRYVFLLNPDAVFLASDDLRNAVAYMESNPSFGLAGMRVLKADSQEAVLPFSRYPDEKHLRKPLPTLPGKIAWVLGASMLIRRDVYASVKGFDEDYFLYGEEADLCLRIRQQGYSIGYCENVAIKHIGGASERQASVEAIQLKKQNGLHLFYSKHYDLADVLRLIKRNRMRARIRLALLMAKKHFFGLTARQLNRYYRYKAIVASSSDFLANRCR